jgi:hypothetical protein
MSWRVIKWYKEILYFDPVTRTVLEKRDMTERSCNVISYIPRAFFYYTLLYSLQKGDAGGVHKYIVGGEADCIYNIAT